MGKISRRDFLIKTGKLGLTCAGLGLLLRPHILNATKESSIAVPDLVIARGDDPSGNTMAAIKALGGIERFVRKGDKVALKPNSITPSGPEVAANTNPFVVETVIRMCMEAGAAEVVVVGHDALRHAEGNGILEVATGAGARFVAAMNRDLYQSVPVLRGKILREVEIIKEILDADVFINTPIVKHHAGAIVTLSMKNLMGINWNRGVLHQNGLQQCIADLNTVVKTDLIVMDATRILLTNGPNGPGQTRDEKAVIAGTDPVAIDAYGTRLLGRNPNDIGHIRCGHELGLGEMDLNRINIKELSLN